MAQVALVNAGPGQSFVAFVDLGSQVVVVVVNCCFAFIDLFSFMIFRCDSISSTTP